MIIRRRHFVGGIAISTLTVAAVPALPQDAYASKPPPDAIAPVLRMDLAKYPRVIRTANNMDQ